MTARTLMVMGTASSVGKSLLVTGLCRMFRQDGLSVAPFKAQNMALNSFVTPGGDEIGRAQAVQAEAAGVVPTADMNPILLKPEGDARSQVVVLGRSIGSLGAVEYHARKPALRQTIAQALARLRAQHDLVVIEGAGSPAEINLKAQDLVNMHVARVADAPVLLVGDIDRGGVFAAFVGTLALLEPDERARIAGFVINKFRGDPALLAPGLEMLRARTGVPVVGVLPYLHGLRLADEDSVSLDDRARRARPSRDELDIVVVRLPRISNHDDFAPLEHAAGVVVRFVESASEVPGADLVILPGSKSTVADLAWLRSSGIAAEVVARARRREPVLGVCGGLQMLGESIEDPHGVESGERRTRGLGLLPVRTRFDRTKITAQVRGRARSGCFLTEGVTGDLTGYEIHMGVVEPTGPVAAPFAVHEHNGRPASRLDGAISPDGGTVGTLIHGILDNAEVCAALLDFLRRRRGLPAAPASPSIPASRQSDYDRLADAVRAELPMQRLRALAGLDPT